MKIDFVITWVDGDDPKWREQRNEYRETKDTDTGKARYRDMDILKYWFRAVSEYAPWVNKVHFVTWGHLPEWLNTEHPKLNIVKHEDYIPEKYLPTFSSHPIELNFHRIKDLSEHFVYFNDDMLLNAPVDENFFFKKGKPCDFAYLTNVYFEQINDIYGYICTNDINAINKEFSYKKSFFKNFTKYVNIRYNFKNNIKNILKLENNVVFSGFEIHHLPVSYKKKTLEDAWEHNFELLDKTSMNKFRSVFDVSQSLFRFRQLATGDFCPVNKKTRGKHFSVRDNVLEIKEALNDKNVKTICINDTYLDVDFEKVKLELVDAYEKKLPHKSEFER